MNKHAIHSGSRHTANATDDDDDHNAAAAAAVPMTMARMVKDGM